MKIVKLNNRYTIYRLHRFEIGLKFPDPYLTDGEDLMAIKRVMGNQFGPEEFSWRVRGSFAGKWATATGKDFARWIYLRDEKMLSVLLLCAGNVKVIK